MIRTACPFCYAESLNLNTIIENDNSNLNRALKQAMKDCIKKTRKILIVGAHPWPQPGPGPEPGLQEPDLLVGVGRTSGRSWNRP